MARNEQMSPILVACLEDLKRLNALENRLRRTKQDGKRDGVVISATAPGSSGNGESKGFWARKKVDIEHDTAKCRCRRGFITVGCVEYSNALFAEEDEGASDKGENKGESEEGKEVGEEVREEVREEVGEETDAEEGEQCLTPTASEFGNESSAAEAET